MSCPAGLVRHSCAPCPVSCAHISSGLACDPSAPCFSGEGGEEGEGRREGGGEGGGGGGGRGGGGEGGGSLSGFSYHPAVGGSFVQL